MDVKTFKVIGMVGMLAEELSLIAADGKVTVNEAIGLIKKICKNLDLDFDEVGFDMVEKKKK
ncbi:MAG TPA: hypothetical protein VK186_10160 [Candidatus Deferrimicrobium sp.]|nr:hypothetical protein [Candidatus Deferrimicrobium sp.]